jgi:hypothetical protein
MRVPLSRLYSHWEMWAGLILCGLCAGVASLLGGVYFGRTPVPAAIGGGIGGYLLSRVHRYVVRRYNLDGL